MSKRKFVVMIAAALVMCLLPGCLFFRVSNKEQPILQSKNEMILESEEEDTEDEKETEEEKMEPDVSRIICWGDSLTFGEGGEGVTFPLVLEEHVPQAQVINYGIRGETAKQIAMRVGVLPMTVSGFTIPKDKSPVQVQLWQDGEDPVMMRLGDMGINPCTIAGVEGILSYDEGEDKYYFTRTEEGEEAEIPEGTQVVTFGDRDKLSSDVIILFAGTNRAPDKNNVQELVDLERQMLEYTGSDRYIVIGLTSKELVPDVVEVNQALSQAFGEHFLDIRKYLLENGLKDAGIEASEQDLKDLENGEIPSSLRVDVVHGNSVCYRLIGDEVYKKLQELGYCP